MMQNRNYSKAAILLLALAASGCSERTAPASNRSVELKDYGTQAIVLDIESSTLANENFRTALWTGENLQVTLMSIPQGGEVGLERHPHIDQFLRVEEGEARVVMGDSQENLDQEFEARSDDAIFIPAGKWHNIVNTGKQPLKMYSIYAPAEHPFGTVHRTQEEAMEAEAAHEHDN